MEKSKTKKYSRVYVEITNVCNKSCSFCPGTKRAARFMSEDEFATVLRKLRGLTDYLYFHLMGEPTLHPKLFDFIALARDSGYRPMLTTNGSLLSKFGERIASSGVHKVNISLHSFEKNDTDLQFEYLNSCTEFAKSASKNGVIVTLRLWNGGTDADNTCTLDFLHKHFPDKWESNSRGEKLAPYVFVEYANRFFWPDIEGESLGGDVYCHGLMDHFAILCDKIFADSLNIKDKNGIEKQI